MMPRYIMGGAGRNQSEKDSLTQELAIRRTPRDAWQEMPNWDAALAVAREWRADTAEARMRRPGRGVQFYAWIRTGAMGTAALSRPQDRQGHEVRPPQLYQDAAAIVRGAPA